VNCDHAGTGQHCHQDECSVVFFHKLKVGRHRHCADCGEVPLPGVTPLGGVFAAPVLPDPGVGPEGATVGGTTPGCGDDPLPG
jgi:hypothetical protein